ncbi:YebC/PmpR family DNA-binding transcriptional regulator [Bacteroidia bacterium]|jgi:YebC/PmpR family DNA-binding regulatory protein|nr:YebC/PmpR family DNA-binding transcriptional regulator [Bacteroidia bacterium]MDC0560859.1 YebC/PmpR family DNA-binding transcriptional regulator [Bacteroidia bacterium]MDC3406317.1 YebC/PmpR family DNA-binding transcriptional regulator [Bacteroidia bacterium]CAI8203876.1 MAG: putative transcriptional regulatory protein [Bacteroidia bacterium]
MGRAFEFRKARKMKRWGKMAVTFTRIGKEISIAVKEGGPDPENNSRLRMAIKNAKSENMPKDRVDAAIKKASDKDSSNYEEILYEGKGPFGLSLMIETATDNINRTVANIRAIFNRNNGELGTSGSQEFNFDRKCIFKINLKENDIEELELELIDFGLEEIEQIEDETLIYTAFTDFGNMQKGLEELDIEIVSVDIERIPHHTITLNDAQKDEVNLLIEKLEEDEDVQNVFHNAIL